MKIILVNPPQLFMKSMTIGAVNPPLGLMYLASACQQEGHSVKIVDALAEGAEKTNQLNEKLSYRGLSFDEIIERIDEDADVVGISSMFSFAFPLVAELAAAIKKKRTAKIVLGGSHVSAVPEYCLQNSEADFAVISEGEKVFVELLRNLGNSEELKKIKSLVYKDTEGIHANKEIEFIENIDSLPFPNRDLVPLEKYYNANEAHGPAKGRWTPILSSRGCPYQCTFCTSKLWNRKWRARSAENVVAEIEHCIKKYNITEFHFEDENLTLDKKRIIRICDLIIKKKLNIRWQTPNGIRASVVDREILKKMKESGCTHICVAPESGSEFTLKLMKKEQSSEKVLEAVKNASELGIKTACFFVIGLPEERKQDVEESIKLSNHLARAGADEVIFSNFAPLPGSELFAELEKHNLLKLDNELYYNLMSMGNMTLAKSWSEHISNQELNQLRRKAYLQFYINKALFHPIKTIKSASNIITGIQELKTERAASSMIKRYLKK